MRYYRKVIHIGAEDSPNVRYARAEMALGRKPSNKVICPGVLTWDELVMRRATWDPVRQCIGLDGKFYMGAQLLLYPPTWLDHAANVARSLAGKARKALGIGCDPAEGGDKSAWAVVDEHGLVELVSLSTPDTTVVPMETIRLMAKHNVPAGRVCLDRGGGGKQHADLLAKMGHRVRTVGFGEKITIDIKSGKRTVIDRREVKASGYEFYNRRAQLFGELSEMMDPSTERLPGVRGFAIPDGVMGDPRDVRTDLRHQLAPIPKLYDEEQRMVMLPKNVPTQDRDPMGGGDPFTLVGLIGHSPDEADALVLAVHAMLHKGTMAMTAGAVL